MKNENRPFIIVTGRYSQKSAGIRAMYVLCDSLNKMGYNAYIYLHPYYPAENVVSYPYICPLINQKLINYFNLNKISPILIYPENIKGSPFGGSTRIRYYLYFPGAWGGNFYEPDHINVCFSRAISSKLNIPTKKLMPPLINTKIFKLDNELERLKICYYSEKFEINGGSVDDKIKKNGVKITRYQNPIMDQFDIYKIFSESKYFYVYENTGLIIEALLSGVIVIIMPSSKLNKMDIIYGPEIEWSGIAFGEDESELERAKLSLYRVNELYSKFNEEYLLDLKNIADEALNNDYIFEPIPKMYFSSYIQFTNSLKYLVTFLSAIKVNGIKYANSYFIRYIRRFIF